MSLEGRPRGGSTGRMGMLSLVSAMAAVEGASPEVIQEIDDAIAKQRNVEIEAGRLKEDVSLPLPGLAHK